MNTYKFILFQFISAFPDYLTFFLNIFGRCVLFHHMDVPWFISSFLYSSTFRLSWSFSVRNNVVVSILLFPFCISCYFWGNGFQKWNHWVKTWSCLRLLVHITLPNCFLSRLYKFTKSCFIILKRDLLVFCLLTW